MKQHLIPVVAACGWFATSALAQDPAQVGPSIYKQLLDNPRVRVLEATFAPGAKIATHAHPDHAAYVLAGGTLHVTGATGKTDVYELKKGQTVWLPAQAHAAVNPGKSTVRVLVIELK
jgi:quercetin dioxygenase-like cupin family protein